MKLPVFPLQIIVSLIKILEIEKFSGIKNQESCNCHKPRYDNARHI